MQPKTIAVLPAYQAAHTLGAFLKMLPKEAFNHLKNSVKVIEGFGDPLFSLHYTNILVYHSGKI